MILDGVPKNFVDLGFLRVIKLFVLVKIGDIMETSIPRPLLQILRVSIIEQIIYLHGVALKDDHLC